VTNITKTEGTAKLCIPVQVPCPSCTLTPGYWKTHNVAFWGGTPPKPTYDAWKAIFTPYYGDSSDGNAELSRFANSFDSEVQKASLAPTNVDGSYFDALWTAPAGNTYWNLSFHYIAAELNLLNGASIIGDGLTAIQAARAFFAATNPQTWESDGYTSSQLTTWKSRLAEFNEGTNWFQCTPDPLTLQWENAY